jgi:phosphoribosylformylglycinamidine (FGAM) synthase-like amidotransferase family enzyme
MEDEETLKTSALVSQLSDAVQNQVHNFFANCVVAPGIIVGCIFLSSDELLRMKQLTVRASTHLICEHIYLSMLTTTFKKSYIELS